MIRKLTHTSIDFIFDLLAEVVATILDLGPLSVQLAQRARGRWVDRRTVPSWNELAHTNQDTVTDFTADFAPGATATPEVSYLDTEVGFDDGFPETQYDSDAEGGFLDSVLVSDGRTPVNA